MIKECHKLQEMRDRDKDDMSDEENDLKSSQESGLFVHSLERAERVLERLDFFKYLRVQVILLSLGLSSHAACAHASPLFPLDAERLALPSVGAPVSKSPTNT